ncbi:MAG: sensor histidine kinase [Spirochaetales bacterium]
MNSEELRRLAQDRVEQRRSLAAAEVTQDSGEGALKAALDELQVHQAELEIQNEDLRETQERLAALSERYHRLFSDAPVGYICVNRLGEITTANKAACRLLDIADPSSPGFFERAFRRSDTKGVYAMVDLARKKGRASGFEFAVPQRGASDRMLQMDAVTVGAESEVYITLTDVTEAYENRQALAKALERNLLMGRETYHRIMNNLELLVALIQLQLEQAADATAQSALESVSSRIQAIIRSQSALHGLEGQLEVDLVKHLKRFVGDLTAGVGSAHELSFESRIASLTVPNDTALHVSLIVNELVTNAVKYAYPDEGGPVKVILRRRDDVYEILVQDKGGGFEGGKDAGRSGSLGLRLVQILAEGQLGGSWAVTADNGTTHAVQFAIPKE